MERPAAHRDPGAPADATLAPAARAANAAILARVRDVARKRPEQEFALNRLYGAHVSPYFTVLCLRLGLSPDQVTIVGGGFGAFGVAMLFLPLGWWSIAGVVALQIGYVLDFSDGQVARITGRSSAAGAYLDWLTHFYVPVGAALAVAASVAADTGLGLWLVAGTMAALELSAFPFSCKEHVLTALARGDARVAASPALRAAQFDDARADDVLGVEPPSDGASPGGIAGRRHRPTLRSLIGDLLIYPGAVHLVTVAVVVDVALGLLLGEPVVPARAFLLAGWAAVLLIHAPLAIRRNHALIRAVEEVSAQDAGERESPSRGDV